MNKAVILSACLLAGCASIELPDAFVYETSLRGQQGWSGAKTRDAAAAELVGAISDPHARLEAAFPDETVKLRRYGLTYAPSNWNLYHAVLDADIGEGKYRVKCRLQSPEDITDAPTLEELRAGGGAELEARLLVLTEMCITEVRAEKG